MTDPRRRLSRAALAAAGEPHPAPPARIVHIGLGAFHRAHQAWYTARAADADDWGIAAFAGRSRTLADQLTVQDGLYTLVERGADADQFTRIGSIVSAHPADPDLLVQAIAAPATAVVTLTVTEAGYALAPNGAPDLTLPELRHDVVLLTADPATAAPGLQTVLGKLLGGLEARRREGAGPLAIVPCDNFSRNGTILADAVRALAGEISPELASWIRRNVEFVSTSVDRITPRVSGSLVDEVATATEWLDAAPIATEPFSDWILSGAFPAGRPAWESSGARFVDDIEPFEHRKLWLLNGAHTLLASLGRLRGHDTVAQAIADPECHTAVQSWWDEASNHLPAEVDAAVYQAALLDRFANPRIAHQLAQIASDGLTKLHVRIVPVTEREIRNGRPAAATAGVIAAWIAAILTLPRAPDARAEDIAGAAASAEPERALLSLAAGDLAGHEHFADLVLQRTAALL